MFHVCVERFDVTGTVGKILGTKRGLRLHAPIIYPPRVQAHQTNLLMHAALKQKVLINLHLT